MFTSAAPVEERGVTTSVADLIRAIRSFIAAYNRNPTP